MLSGKYGHWYLKGRQVVLSLPGKPKATEKNFLLSDLFFFFFFFFVLYSYLIACLNLFFIYKLKFYFLIYFTSHIQCITIYSSV